MPKRRGIVFVISAPSGCGKTSLIKALLKEEVDLVHPVSFTTRAKRSDEKGGADYRFISEAAFKRYLKKGKFLEWSKPFGCYYATPRDTIIKNLKRGKDVILSLDRNGALFIKRRFKGTVLIYVLPPSLKILRERLIGRSTDGRKEILKRLSFAKEDISNLNGYDYTVINDNFGEAVSKLRAILIAERHRVR